MRNKKAILSGGCFKMGSVDIVLPSRDSARIAKSELLTVQIYELFLKLASILPKK